MERAVALKKLRKILGDKLGYRIDPKAPDAETRAAARDNAKVLNAEYKAVAAALEKRREEVLALDPTYQALRHQTNALHEAKDRAWSTARHCKITVGVEGDVFFYVRATGDSWEDVIKQLEVKR